MGIIFRNLAKFLTYQCSRCRTYSGKREARMLRKMIGKEEKINRKKSSIPKACSLHQYAHYTLCAPESRRKTVLNKIFTDHVNELMSTGTYADEVFDHGIHVTQTKITPNYHLLYVFWIHTKEINESEANDLLKKIASYVRYELNSLKVMGQVPEVRFVKDEEFMKIQYAESILEQLKIAQDEHLTNESLPDQENVPNKLELQLPPMVYNVFGLEYLRIMNNIQNTMKIHSVRPSEVSAESNAQQIQEIQKFNKKELAKVMFSKHYAMKKSRSRIKADESILLDED